MRDFKKETICQAQRKGGMLRIMENAELWIKCSCLEFGRFASEMMKWVSSRNTGCVELTIRFSGLRVLSLQLFGGMELVPCTACYTFPL